MFELIFEGFLCVLIYTIYQKEYIIIYIRKLFKNGKKNQINKVEKNIY